MGAYLKFFASCILWQIIYGKILDLATWLVSVPFGMINTWLISIPVAVRSYLKALLYSFLVIYGVLEYNLNPLILSVFFVLEMLAFTMFNGKAEDEQQRIVWIINFFSKLAIVPIFIFLSITKITFGYAVIELFFDFINWLLSIPVLGAVIKFIITATSSWFAFVIFAILLIVIIVMIVIGWQKIYGKIKRGKKEKQVIVSE